MSFKPFNFHPTVLDGLQAMNFEEATPIQQEAIPIILRNVDLIACAQTGTGKTAAYLLPILHKLATQNTQHVNTLVIAPTRELAQQIDRQVEAFSYFVPNVTSFPIYGGGDGVAFEQQKKALKKGANIIIATPGKLISHLTLNYAKLEYLQHLVLDEADKMLDMGFLDDIMKIISFLPDRQTLLFSATMPDKIRKLAKRILKAPEQVSIAISKPAEGILQAAYMTYGNQKMPVLTHLVGGKGIESVIVFSGTKRNADAITAQLKQKGVKAGVIHSDLDQSQREETLRLFRNHKINVLVATDIISRGIDIENIEMIINYDVPQDAEDYVHRIGRTARSSSTGVAVTLVNPADQSKLYRIEQLIEKPIKKARLPKHLKLGAAPKYNPKSANKKGGGRYKRR